MYQHNRRRRHILFGTSKLNIPVYSQSTVAFPEIEDTICFNHSEVRFVDYDQVDEREFEYQKGSLGSE